MECRGRCVGRVRVREAEEDRGLRNDVVTFCSWGGLDLPRAAVDWRVEEASREDNSLDIILTSSVLVGWSTDEGEGQGVR